MKVGIFSVYDSAAQRYLEAFTAPTVEFALRGFRQAVITPDHQFGQFPEDYTLFQLAELDLVSGTVEGLAAPQKLISAFQVTGLNGQGKELASE